MKKFFHKPFLLLVSLPSYPHPIHQDNLRKQRAWFGALAQNVELFRAVTVNMCLEKWLQHSTLGTSGDRAGYYGSSLNVKRRTLSLLLCNLFPEMYCHHWKKYNYFLWKSKCITCKSFMCCLKYLHVNKHKTSHFPSISTVSFWSWLKAHYKIGHLPIFQC